MMLPEALEEAAPPPSSPWVRHLRRAAYALFVVEGVVMTVGLFLPTPYGSRVQNWGLFLGTLAAVLIVESIGNRIVERLTQIIALFTTDVPPQQPPSEPDGPGNDDDTPSVTAIYRSRSRSS